MATSELEFWRVVVTGKTGRTIGLVLALASLPLILPPLQRPLRGKGQNYKAMLPDLRELVSFKSNRSAPDTISSSNSTIDTPPAHDPTDPCSADSIDDPTHALDHFYSALASTELKKPGAITRITHYGDSPITNDGITGTTRRLMQERFGDAGHGFILVDRPWGWYGHQSITFTTSGGWSSDSLMNPMTKDGLFGLGGVTFQASPGKSARFAPATTGDTGRNFSRLDVYYLAQPNGGQFTVSDGESGQTISSNSDTSKASFQEIKSAKSGAHTFEIKTISGNVRMFGAVLENDGPGVVYDSLGVNGAYAGLLARVMNEQHWAEQLRHRNPDLLILNYGTNESEYASDDQMARYEKDLREVVRRVRAALPEVSILIVSPMDRGRHAVGGRIDTLDSIPKIVEMQHRVARDTGCGFLDLYAAMGGAGTMARWHDGRHHLVGGDLTHPNTDGAITVGVLIYDALVEGYSDYRARVRAVEQTLAQQKQSSNAKTKRR